jgi:predicted amidohydrolase YtcJ
MALAPRRADDGILAAGSRAQSRTGRALLKEGFVHVHLMQFMQSGRGRRVLAGSASSPPPGSARAVTVEAAYSWRLEDKIGSVAPGKIANFTALEEDPYAFKPIRLKDVPVWGTVFEGAVYPVERG